MDTNEINQLAKTHAEAILLSSLTRAELIMLLACIQARVEQMLFKPTEPTPAPASVPVKATTKELGKVIAEKGSPCVCVMCSKHIYTVAKDVYENSTVGDFIESYTPMPGYKPLTRKSRISNIENNITMDCPECGGELSLYLAGKQI